MPRSNEYKIGSFFQTEPGKVVGKYLLELVKKDADPLDATQYPHITQDYDENRKRISAVIEGARHMVEPPLDPNDFSRSDVFVAIQTFMPLARALENPQNRNSALPSRH